MARLIIKIIKIIIYLITSFVMLVALAIFAPVIYNNILLERYFTDIERNLEKLGVTIVHYEKRVGGSRYRTLDMDMEIVIAFNSDKQAQELSDKLEKSDIVSPFSKDNDFMLCKQVQERLMIYKFISRFGNKFVPDKLVPLDTVDLFDDDLYNRLRGIMLKYHSDYIVVYADQTYSGFSMWDIRADH